MSPVDTVRRLLRDAAGEALCVACLADMCATTLSEMQAIIDDLLAEDAFQRGWTCVSCTRPRATIVFIRKCAHCSVPLDGGDRGSRMGGELFHLACLSRLVADDTIRLSGTLSRRSRDLIEQSRRRMWSSNAVIRPRRAAADRSALRARGRRRALVIDDDQDDRDRYAYYLEHIGWYVEVAPDAASGIRIAQREPFDVIVMAASMPGMDGAEATRRLKADERTRAIPILIMIDDAQESGGRAAVEAGAAGTCLASSSPERVEDEIHNIAGSGIP